MEKITSFDLLNRARERQEQARVDALLEPYDDEFLDRIEALLKADPDLDIPGAIALLKSQN